MAASKKDISSELAAFREYLRAKRLKVTRERELILREICSRQGHFDPEELYLEMRKKGIKVSKASVYRTIPHLVGAGIMEQVEKTDKHAHYEHVFGYGHHDHMLCVSCGKVIEFYSGHLERLQDRLCRSEGFRSMSHTLEIKGYCRACRSKKSGPGCPD